MTLIGSTTAIFAVQLSQELTEQVDTQWSTRDGTAKAGTDYVAGKFGTRQHKGLHAVEQ